MNKVCVLGSMNMDVVLKVNAMPKEGETIFAQDIKNIPGGKGANQAVASKRAGNQVYMIAKVGNDSNGTTLVNELKKDNINTDYIFVDDKNTTGTAIITVDSSGKNSIIVVAGSNMKISKNEIEKSKKAIEESDMVISQFETPIEAAIEAFKIAKDSGKTTILNPAPAKRIDDELLKYTDIIIPNETEAYTLTGVYVNDIDSCEKAAHKLINKGVKFVIITLGAKGAALVTKDNSEIIPAYKVNAIDTTAAGDSFIGGFSSKLNINSLTFENVKNAIKFGNQVSSISVQREGAQPSIPYLDEVKNIYGEV